MLTPASEASRDQLNDRVTGVHLGLLYHVVTSRNAWHSTWINRYRPDSMHISFEAAQTYCESRRVQGTVFNIFQLPSLVFRSGSGHLIVSELNSKTYFSRLKLGKLKGIYDVLPVATLSLNQVRRLFRAESPLWEEGYPHQDSAVFTFDALKQELEPLPEQLTRWQSTSVGSSYFLEWRDNPLADHDTDPLEILAMRPRYNLTPLIRFE